MKLDNVTGESPLIPERENQNHPVRQALILLLRGYLTLMMPVLLVLISVRVVMTPLFLQIEYNRPGFPADTYGFTTEDRLEYAPYAVNYLLNGADISYLGDLTFPDGEPLYNERELIHMEDVKVVTRAAYFILFFGGLGAILAVVALRRLRGGLKIAVMQGSLLTLGIIIMIILGAVVAWDFFFDTFHALLFEEGTWRFAYSDTLIRLFPEQFWFDAAIVIGVLTISGALVMLGWSIRRGQN